MTLFLRKPSLKFLDFVPKSNEKHKVFGFHSKKNKSFAFRKFFACIDDYYPKFILT